MRGGVAEQNKVLQHLRKECRVAANMAGVKGLSLLSADPNMTRLGKRKRQGNNETMSADAVLSRRRIAL